jgi:hypothetical protein
MKQLRSQMKAKRSKKNNCGEQVPLVLLYGKDGFDIKACPYPTGSVGKFPIFRKQWFVPLNELIKLRSKITEELVLEAKNLRRQAEDKDMPATESGWLQAIEWLESKTTTRHKGE